MGADQVEIKTEEYYVYVQCDKLFSGAKKCS